jgi:hypothetical protein
MTFTGCSTTSLNTAIKNDNIISALADRKRRRLPAFEHGTIIVWALTPLIVAAVAAVS